MPPSFRARKTLLAALSKNHWIWIASLYGLQAFGSLVVAPLLRLPLKEVFFPILLLFVGAVFSLAMALRHRSRECSFGKWECWIPPLIYALFIFLLSHRSFHGASMPFSGNYFHPLEYASLAIFLCCVWHPIIENKGATVFCLTVVGTGIIYGITDEAHQSFIPGRDPSLLDLFLDALGLAIGCGLFLLARHAGAKMLNNRKEGVDNARPHE